MILIDNRVGSRELAPLFPKSLVRLRRLPFGDFSFEGKGPEPDKAVAVGVERKTIHDLLSGMRTGRLAAHQLPGLVDAYDYVYLVVEGLWRANPRSGILEVRGQRKGGKAYAWIPLGFGQRRYMARDVWNYINTMDIVAGVHIRLTGGMGETAGLVRALHSWWTVKEYAEHRSHLALHMPPEVAALRKPGLVRRVAAELPGIGWTRSLAVEGHFASVWDMVVAHVQDWRKVEGVGKVTAERVVAAIQGEE